MTDEYRDLNKPDLEQLTAAIPFAYTGDLPREKWLELRRQGLGGSDAAAVLGISRWASPYALWLDKTGRSDSTDNTSTRLRAGQHMETFVIAEAELAIDGLNVDRCPWMLHHPDHPEIMVNLDGVASLATRRGPGVFEAKTADQFVGHQWDDGVPPAYEAQVHHALAVTGWDWALVAVLIGFGRPEFFFIEADPDFQAKLVEAEAAWWADHVVVGHEPVADGSPATTEALSLLIADPGVVRQLDPDEDAEVAQLFAQLAHDRAVAADAEESENQIKNRLRQLIGDAEALVGPDGEKYATWKQQKAKTVVDWQGALTRAAFGLGVPVPELTAPHTTTKPGNRPLVPTAGLNRLAKAQADANTTTSPDTKAA